MQMKNVFWSMESEENEVKKNQFSPTAETWEENQYTKIINPRKEITALHIFLNTNRRLRRDKKCFYSNFLKVSNQFSTVWQKENLIFLNDKMKHTEMKSVKGLNLSIKRRNKGNNCANVLNVLVTQGATMQRDTFLYPCDTMRHNKNSEVDFLV
jgi:hypothetical protein